MKIILQPFYQDFAIIFAIYFHYSKGLRQSNTKIRLLFEESRLKYLMSISDESIEYKVINPQLALVNDLWIQKLSQVLPK